MTWGEFRRRAQQQRAEFDENLARMRVAQAAAQAQRAAAPQAEQCPQLARTVFVQTTPIDAAEAQEISRCPQLAQYLTIRNAMRETDEELGATEPSTPQFWHCEHACDGGADCDAR